VKQHSAEVTNRITSSLYPNRVRRNVQNSRNSTPNSVLLAVEVG
jgi:hypothetical protein